LDALVRPASLDELGPQAALEALADRTRATGVEIDLAVDLDFEAGRMAARHEPELETAVYRIVQEAINNAVKHSVPRRSM
jgi:two-component system, NarL family, sensor histidine kinase DevS